MNTLLVPLGSTLSPIAVVAVGILLVAGIALFILGGRKKSGSSKLMAGDASQAGKAAETSSATADSTDTNSDTKLDGDEKP